MEDVKGDSGYFQPKTRLEVASADPIQQQCEGSTEKDPQARIWPPGIFTSAWERLPSACNGRASFLAIIYLPQISPTLKTPQV